MPSFDPKDHHPRYFYQLFMGALIPRPVGWVTTLNEKGSVNLAPMSCFNAINTRPPMVMISVGDQDGELKHTVENIYREKECVIHIPEFHELEAVHQSAGHYPKNESEATLLGLETTGSETVKTPSLKATKIRFECILHSVHELPSNHVIFLEIKNLIIDESLMENGVISNEKFKPIARLSGGHYSPLGDPVHLNKYPLKTESESSD
jgi:flavin reductase (DIM6/NTAB) family NADH-FMN oxidoreductase RutF